MKTGRELFQTGILCAAALALGILGEPRAHAQPGTEVWVQRFGNDAEFAEATAVAVDASGNVFVTGWSFGNSNGYDYLTIKYAVAGLPLWTNRFNGPTNGNDTAQIVVVDRSGNVFIVGGSTGDGSGSDFLTIKYSGKGVPIWTNRFNGPGNIVDSASAAVADGDGNVVVTGHVDGFQSYATIKYSGEGEPLWTNFYGLPANKADSASDVAVDGDGNVFVTGSSYDAFGRNFGTIAYSSAGTPLWTNHFNGAGNSDDAAAAIVADTSGHVFVTGSSDRTNVYPNNTEYATIAYSSSGVVLWTNYYRGPGNGSAVATAAAVDGTGNVFVTGFSTGLGSGYDYATIAYSSGGVPLWTNRYNGPTNYDDRATAVTVDGRGHVYVTGYSMGNCTDYDYATVAYSNTGTPLWTNRYNGLANGSDMPITKRSLVAAPDGVIVVGRSDGDFTSGIRHEYAVVKCAAGFPFAITATEAVGNHLRLNFTSQAGYHYNVQARTNLASGGWINVGTNIPGAGALTQTTVTNALLAPQQFYRIQQSP